MDESLQRPASFVPTDPDIDLGSLGQRAEAGVHPGTLPSIILGGMLGACARHGLEVLWPTHAGAFPWGTFVTNVSGSLSLGFLMVLVLETQAAHPLLRPFAGVGLIGGYTTFSTYTVQTRVLLTGGDAATGLAAGYLFATVAATFVAVALGLTAGRLLSHGHWRRHKGVSPESASPGSEVAI